MLKLQIVPYAVALSMELEILSLEKADDEEYLREADEQDITLVVCPNPFDSFLRKFLIEPCLDSDGYIRDECRGVPMVFNSINYVIMPESKMVADAKKKLINGFMAMNLNNN